MPVSFFDKFPIEMANLKSSSMSSSGCTREALEALYKKHKTYLDHGEESIRKIDEYISKYPQFNPYNKSPSDDEYTRSTKEKYLGWLEVLPVIRSSLALIASRLAQMQPEQENTQSSAPKI